MDEEYEHRPEHGHVEPLFAALRAEEHGRERLIGGRVYPVLRWILFILGALGVILVVLGAAGC